MPFNASHVTHSSTGRECQMNNKKKESIFEEKSIFLSCTITDFSCLHVSFVISKLRKINCFYTFLILFFIFFLILSICLRIYLCPVYFEPLCFNMMIYLAKSVSNVFTKCLFIFFFLS
jgi:hypothetical protein